MADAQIAIIDGDQTQVVLAPGENPAIVTSIPGPQGPAGAGVPTGGAANEVLYKVSSTFGDTAWGPITSAMIGDLQIVNADVSASAAIAGTKISPNFGSQNVTTTGTSTAASFIPTSSTAPTNGVYLPAANSVALSTGGTGRLFVDASGNVLIGATGSASRLLTVNQTGATGGEYGIRVSQQSATSNAIDITIDSANGVSKLFQKSTIPLVFGTNDTERLRITSAGLVGIGTSTPWSTLTVGSGGTANPTADATIHASSIDQYRLKLTSVNFNADTKWLGLGFGYSDNYMKVGILAEAKDANARANLHFCLNNAASSANASLSDSRMVITSAGLVGIGHTSPGAFVDVAGDIRSRTANPVVYLNNLVTQWGLRNNGDALTAEYQGTERLRITSAGLVGIGTTSANSLLEVQGTSDQTTLFTLGCSTGANNGSITNVLKSTCFNNNFWANLRYDATAHIWRSNGTEIARLDSSGRLLVGTSSTFTNVYHATTALVQAPLQVRTATNNYNSGTTFLNYSSSGFAPVVTLGLSKSDTAGINATATNNSELGYLQFVGNDGTNFRTAAWITASVDGDSGTGDMPGRLVFSTTADGASSPTERMRISANGNIDYGTFSTTGATQGRRYSDSGRYCLSSTNSTDTVPHHTFYNPNGAVGSIQTSGSATAFNTSSDYRLKENVAPVTDGITRLQQLKPSRFNFIADPDKTVDGFIAHEVQAIVPEAITGEKDAVDDEGNPVYQGIDQSKLVPLLTAALQEALAKIESLEARLDAANL